MANIQGVNCICLRIFKIGVYQTLDFKDISCSSKLVEEIRWSLPSTICRRILYLSRNKIKCLWLLVNNKNYYECVFMMQLNHWCLNHIESSFFIEEWYKKKITECKTNSSRSVLEQVKTESVSISHTHTNVCNNASNTTD